MIKPKICIFKIFKNNKHSIFNHFIAFFKQLTEQYSTPNFFHFSTLASSKSYLHIGQVHHIIYTLIISYFFQVNNYIFILYFYLLP